MARPKIAPEVLADRGKTLALADGTKVSVCYSFQSLMLLEERYGSISAAVEIISDPEGAAFTSIAGVLACGLAHEIEPEGGDGNMLSDPAVLAAYLDPQDLQVYAEVMGDAFSAAFPKHAEEETPDPTQATETAPSLGESGTTPPSSTSDSPPPSSGA